MIVATAGPATGASRCVRPAAGRADGGGGNGRSTSLVGAGGGSTASTRGAAAGGGAAVPMPGGSAAGSRGYSIACGAAAGAGVGLPADRCATAF
jgi:hypothetical protein